MASIPDIPERLRAALADRYRLEEAVGSGGMATVYRAEDLKHHRNVAVKVLDPELAAAIGAERFLREIDTAAKLTHPHILPLHDSGQADGFLFFVMPFVKGESLRDLLNKEGQLAVEDALRYAHEIAGALAYAHDEGIIHRDVKPANVLLEAGHAVLADFGISQAAAGAGDARMTRTNVSLGSPAYMSPEQISGERSLDARSDQYALACVLQEMLLGQPPFTGVNTAQIMARQISESPSKVSLIRPSVGPEVDAVIGRALEMVPADRFGSMGEFSRALSRAAAAAVVGEASAVPVSRRPPSGMGSGLRWLLSTVSMMVLVLVGGLLFLGSTNDFGFQKRDWILVTGFQNGTDESVFDRSLNNALAVGLQQSSHLNVFPKTRISQTLQRMLREDTGEVGEELGREIALRENIQLLVVPSIDRVDQTYLLAIRIIDPSSGQDLLSRSAQAEGSNEVLPALDRLARRLRRDLGESRLSISRQSVPLRAATTPSLEALEAWSEGDFHFGNRNYAEAFTLLRRAIELDSSFAMAHADLGGAYYLRGDRENGDIHIEKALSLTDRVTERERLWISAEIESWKQNYEGAIDAYNIYLTRYGDDLDGWFRLGYAQMREGRSAEAVLAFDSVVAMDPENAAGFINLATSHNQQNELEEAVRHYLKAFELSPAWLTSGNLNHEFGFNYVELGEFERAEAVFREMFTGDENQRALGNRSLALMRMFMGRYTEAREHLREAAFLHQTLGAGLSEMRDRLYLVVALLAVDSTEAALEELTRVGELANSATVAPSWLANIGKVMSRNGLVEEADEILETAVQRLDESVPADRAAVALLRGEIGLAGGDFQGAVNHFRTASALGENPFQRESLAFGLYQAGDLEGALDQYLAFLDQPELGWEAQEFWLRSHYRVGQIYEALGDPATALEFYGALLGIWKEADENLPLLNSTRERAEALATGI